MLPIDDLKQVLSSTESLWNNFRGKRIFISGGTGFVGSWLIESFLFANKALSLNAEMVVLSRDPAAFLSKCSSLRGEKSLVFVQGDVRSFTDPSGDFNYVIHAATDPTTSVDPDKVVDALSVSIDGTKRVLEFCKNKKVKKFLYISSGAIYGKQPGNISHLDESFSGGPDLTKRSTAYAEGKRVGEWLTNYYGATQGFEVVTARLFAFVGPYLPLDGPYAAGNFIRDVLANQDIVIKSDGLAKRSYMYAADMAIWLWHILMAGKTLEAYNVGSEQAVSIRDLAQKIISLENSNVKVIVKGMETGNLSGDTYVPSNQKAAKELGLKSIFGEDQAFKKTLEFYKKTEETR